MNRGAHFALAFLLVGPGFLNNHFVWGQAPLQPTPALTDAHSDPLPPGALARLGTLRFRHDGNPITDDWRCPVNAVAYSPNGRLLASACQDHTVRLWDAHTGKQLLCVRLASVAKAVAFAPQGQTFAYGSAAGELCLAEVATGKLIHRLPGHKNSVLSVAFSSDGRTLASASADQTVRLWNCVTGQETFVFKDHEGEVFWVAFANKQGTVASGSQDGSVRFWEAATGKELDRFQGQPKALHRVALSADGKTLAVGGVKGALWLQDLATGKGRQFQGGALQGYNGRAEALAFSPDGKWLVGIGTYDRAEISVWEVATGKEVHSWKGKFDVCAVTFAPDGNTIALADGCNTVRLWDTTTGKERPVAAGHHGRVLTLAVSPDGSKIASAGLWEHTCLWDAHTGKQLYLWDTAPHSISSMAFSPDGKMLAGSLDEYNVVLWSVATGRKLAHLKGPKIDQCINSSRSLVFSPDGKTLVASGRVIRVYDVAGAKHRRDLKGDAFLSCAAVAADNRTLAVTGRGLVAFLDLETGKEVEQLGFGARYAYAAFVGDGSRLLAADHEGPIVLWDTKAKTKPLRLFSAGPHAMVAASPDGKFVATAGDQSWPFRSTPESRLVRVWEVATGQEIAKFAGHTGPVSDLAFTPDCRRVVSASFDATTLVWDLTGRLQQGQLRPALLEARELEAAWTDLASAKTPEAYRAVWALVSNPVKSVPFLAERLRPQPKNTERANRCIKDLADDQNAVRARAAKELLELGAAAIPALQKTLTNTPPVQVRERVLQVLKNLEPARIRELHRHFRVVLTLEQVATKEARAMLRQLAERAEDRMVQQEAAVALARLQRQL